MLVENSLLGSKIPMFCFVLHSKHLDQTVGLVPYHNDWIHVLPLLVYKEK